ncbi:MAG: hypothetical protein OHK0019_15620 [Saprospiraceae bacterium]
MNWYNDQLLVGVDERIPDDDSVTTHMAFYTQSFDSLKTFQFVRDLGGTSREFRQTSDGDLLHLRTVNKLNGKEAHVIKTDTNGNVLWKHVLEKSDWNFATDLVLLPDGGVATHWNKQITVWSEDTFEFVDYVVKLDWDGNEVWRHYLYSPYLLRWQLDHLFAAQNGDIIGCGYYIY